MAGYRVLDIETVVDDRYWDRPPSKWTSRPLDVRVGGTDDYPIMRRETEWVVDEPFPPPQAHRVVAMAWVDLSGDDGKWYSFEGSSSLCNWSYGDGADVVERDLLESFKKVQEGDEACLVTWNGRTFDLPVVNMRSFLHRISCEWYYKERDLRYRYTEACHCDLMDFFSDFGAARSMKLGDVARLAGLPGKIGGVSGGNVGNIYDAHDSKNSDVKFIERFAFKSIAQAKKSVGAYCLLDAMQTAVLFGLSRVHKGMIDLDYYHKVVASSFVKPIADAIKQVEKGAAS